TETINTARRELPAALAELTAGDGPEVVVEAIGLPATFRAAVEQVGYAGRVVYIGYAQDEVAYQTKQFILKEIDILGSRNALPQDFAAVVALLESGRFPTQRAITRTVPFAAAGEALRAWDAAPGEVTRIHVLLP
ncbi:MAG: zinc-binding dehydrogenase, partial [Armatimonadetes bacterium]|nr:zinc-binding dehydrogenase [Armatimonadota bacterium]